MSVLYVSVCFLFSCFLKNLRRKGIFSCVNTDWDVLCFSLFLSVSFLLSLSLTLSHSLYLSLSLSLTHTHIHTHTHTHTHTRSQAYPHLIWPVSKMSAKLESLLSTLHSLACRWSMSGHRLPWRYFWGRRTGGVRQVPRNVQGSVGLLCDWPLGWLL